MRRSIIIFDLNGTLFDSVPGLIDDAVGVLRDEYGVAEAVSRPAVHDIVGRPPEGLFAGFAELTGRGVDEGRRVMSLIAARFEERPPVLFPEVPEVLADLDRLGYTLVISATMDREVMDRHLREAGIRDRFRLLMGAQPTRAVLKGPEHFAIAARELGLSLEELVRRAVRVGDSPYDMQLAREAGIVAIGRRTNDNDGALRAAGADYVIGDLRELESLLARLD